MNLSQSQKWSQKWLIGLLSLKALQHCDKAPALWQGLGRWLEEKGKKNNNLLLQYKLGHWFLVALLRQKTYKKPTRVFVGARWPLLWGFNMQDLVSVRIRKPSYVQCTCLTLMTTLKFRVFFYTMSHAERLNMYLKNSNCLEEMSLASRYSPHRENCFSHQQVRADPPHTICDLFLVLSSVNTGTTSNKTIKPEQQ